MPQASHSLMLDISEPALTPDERAFFEEQPPGSVIIFRPNVVDRVQVSELCQELREICGADLLIATDQEGGSVVRMQDVPVSPGTMALGSADDAELTEQVAAAMGRGLHALGVNLDLAPCADVNNNPQNPVIGERSFGEKPEHVAKHVASFVTGLQREGVAATLKHFPGHGDTAVDSHLGLPTLEHSMSHLQATELVPFKAGIAAGAECIMSYHGVVTALDEENPATLSKKVMTDFLRGDLGFEGVSISDALEMKAISAERGEVMAGVAALNAGIDLINFNRHRGDIKIHETFVLGLQKALDTGDLNSDILTSAQARLKTLAQRYPARYAPDTAWRDGDEALLNKAAAKALKIVGDFEPLTKTTPITLLSRAGQVGGAAADVIDSPVGKLEHLLKKEGVNVQRINYDVDKLEPLPPQTGVTLIVTTSRTRPGEEEVRFLKQAFSAAELAVHVALWNPYIVADLPQPAVVSYGFQIPSLKAVVAALYQP